MATYVLVHGGWCASWCWDFNVKALEQAGHKVICVDLPGHGNNDSVPLTEVKIADHIKCVKEAVEDSDEPVILVAHSMTGMVISQVAEDMPEKISKAVYFAAFLPDKDGCTQMELLATDPWTLISPKTTVITDDGLANFNMKYARNMGFNTSSDEAFGYAATRMQPENPTMWSEPVHITERFEGVDKVYIHTLKDNCCSYYLQRSMVQKQPCVAQFYLDSDHVGMLSDAENTNKILLAIAQLP